MNEESGKLPMEPANRTVIRHPRREALTSYVTPIDDHYILAALGVPRVADPSGWRIHVDGSVRYPYSLSLAELRLMPQTTITATLECAGDPVNPDKPTRDVSTARWSGIRIADLLDRAQPTINDGYLWIDGADYGVYRPGTPVAERVDCYRKDIPLDRARHGGALLALAMNGGELPAVHGFPVRAFIPGYYGTNCVKWVTHLTVARGRPAGLFCSVLYNNPLLIDGAIERRPDGPVRVNSIFTSDSDGDHVPVGWHVFSGWAWADTPVVNVKVGDGSTWTEASLEPRADHAWQWFSAKVLLEHAGIYKVSAVATDELGNSQPWEEHINQVMTINVVAFEAG